ncbi:omptin family outer membrane protease [Methylobacterium sp. SyP6R]|uniref:omptin family outer membrane protease n=1 Tax=Methylobacterium sp. SyP6R TaxID=2718876 RepID=UPI001F006EDC|nr:omptin family outer membrane protease [Methylobacterium sp. SyP6R]MCF4129776.1 omptin family outer membrane protease [Methylobacterium sp. SyP6R]
MRTVLLGLWASLLFMPAAGAADLFAEDTAEVLRGNTFSGEVFTGYLRSEVREYVNDVGSRARVSQLNWNTDAAVVGGRLALQPLDWLAIRGRGWAAVASSADMRDYDWLYGYAGKNSWSHYSNSPNTQTPKAWQLDISAAATFYEDEETKVYAIAGYRALTLKSNARGGGFIYSQNGFRDTAGTFPDDKIGVAYQQWWQTPYVGIGGSFAYDDWSVSGELIGSPFAYGNDKDHHAARHLVFREDFGTTGMFGATASVEYRINPFLSAVGRVEYQQYFEGNGPTRITSGLTGATTTLPAPSGSGSAETMLLSVGLKARL